MKSQFQDIRNELVNHEKIVAESRKVRELGDHLQGQLDFQREHSRELESQIESLRSIEANLKARSDQLESELSDLRSHPQQHGPEAEPTGLQEALTDLQQHLKKAEEDLRSANSRTDQHDLVQFKLRQEIAEYKVGF